MHIKYNKMNLPQISIIVPVYNVEQYITNCIESILAQTFQNWELLLIDDGSPDKSGEICDKYAMIDNRIVTFHKENAGVSSARNLGLKNIKGKWVMFVDADDMLYNNALQVLINYVSKTKYDIIQFCFNRTWNEGMTLPQDSLGMSNKDYIKYKHAKVSVWCNLIRSTIIINNNLTFNENLKLGEDQLFIFDVLSKSRYIIHIPDVLYFYRPNEMSASNNAKIEDTMKSIKAFKTYKLLHPNFEKLVDRMLLYYLSELSINENISIKDISVIYKDCNILTGKYLAKKSQMLYWLSKININFSVASLRILFLFKKTFTKLFNI